jgi:hypothetical protein
MIGALSSVDLASQDVVAWIKLGLWIIAGCKPSTASVDKVVDKVVINIKKRLNLNELQQIA